MAWDDETEEDRKFFRDEIHSDRKHYRPDGPPRICELDARILAGIIVTVVSYYVNREFIGLEEGSAFFISSFIGVVFAIALR
jgi:hypothetical protein